MAIFMVYTMYLFGFGILRVYVLKSRFFFLKTFDFSPMNSAPVHHSRILQNSLFNHFFIKNGSHDTIYTFKNYFASMFSVLVFSFSKNKLYPNGPYILLL